MHSVFYKRWNETVRFKQNCCMVTLSLNSSYLNPECHKLKVIKNSDVRQVWDQPIQTDLDQEKIIKQGSSLVFIKVRSIPAFKHELNTFCRSSVCWFQERDDEQGPVLTVKSLRAQCGSQSSKYTSLMKYHNCFVGFTDNSQGDWKEKLIMDGRRRGSGEIRAKLELRLER